MLMQLCTKAPNIQIVRAHMNKPRDSMAISKTGKEYTVVTV